MTLCSGGYGVRDPGLAPGVDAVSCNAKGHASELVARSRQPSTKTQSFALQLTASTARAIARSRTSHIKGHTVIIAHDAKYFLSICPHVKQWLVMMLGTLLLIVARRKSSCTVRNPTDVLVYCIECRYVGVLWVELVFLWRTFVRGLSGTFLLSCIFGVLLFVLQRTGKNEA